MSEENIVGQYFVKYESPVRTIYHINRTTSQGHLFADVISIRMLHIEYNFDVKISLSDDMYPISKDRAIAEFGDIDLMKCFGLKE